jgi:hypothetical protein
MPKFGTLPPKYNGKHPGGRPTKKTPELIAKLTHALAVGLPDEEACALVMIERCTLDAWRNEDDQFSYMLKSARAQKMVNRIGRIDDGEPGWQGSAWMLERRYPQHFSRPELNMTIEHNVHIDNQVKMVGESELLRINDLTRDIESEVV